MSDTTDDGFDTFDDGFLNIWDVLYSQTDDNFAEFYTAWRVRGHDVPRANAAIYQNTIDYNNPPSCEIISPNGGGWYSGTITVSASASDDSGGYTDGTVSQVEFEYYDTTWHHIGTDTSPSGGWNVEWDTTAISYDPTVWVRAKAWDNLGGASEWDESDDYFGIDNTGTPQPLWTRYSSRIDNKTQCLGVGGFAVDSEDNVIIASNRDVIKYDSNGNVLWEYDMCGCGVVVDKTDDSVVVGLCNSSIIKFSKTGGILWTKELQEELYLSSVKSVNSDGNILAAGFGSISGVWDSYFEIRDKNGNFIRSTTRPHNGWWPAAIFAESGYIYLAYDLAQGVAIEKVADDFSSTLWTTTLSNCTDYVGAMTVDSENNLFVRGNTGVGGVGYNQYTAKLNGANGDVLWERIYDSGYQDFGGGLTTDPAGDLLVTGTTDYETGSKDKAGILTIKYDGSDGAELEHILYRKSTNDELFEVACGIARDSNGYIYIGGKEYDISNGEGCGIETRRALTMKYEPF